MCMCDRHAGVLFGISNTVATIPGMLAPTVAGLLTPNVSYLLMLSLHVKILLSENITAGYYCGTLCVIGIENSKKDKFGIN